MPKRGNCLNTIEEAEEEASNKHRVSRSNNKPIFQLQEDEEMEIPDDRPQLDNMF